jgi:hypothetical protein
MSNDGMGEAPRLFRLWVRKGSPFAVQPRHNPVVTHDGGTTAAHLVLTGREAELLRGLLAQYGGEVDLVPTAEQTPEQKVEREALLGVGREDTVWPSAACPECAWFDPLLPDIPCGRAGWPSETITTFIKADKPYRDIEACPVPHVWGEGSPGG